MSVKLNVFIQILVTTIYISKMCALDVELMEGVAFFKNTWLVQVSGGVQVLQNIAAQEQFEIIEEVQYFPGLYHVRYPNHPKRGKYANKNITQRLNAYNEVSFAEQIRALKNELRELKCPKMQDPPPAIEHYRPVKDPYYASMWYLHDCRNSAEEGPNISLNVFRVWHEFKIFGSGIKVLVVDEGMDTSHPEIFDNYDEDLCYDPIDEKDDPDPGNQKNSHGTSCAGIIAGKANNLFCGVGIAPLATLGAVRILQDNIKADDRTEGYALSFKYDEIHISNNSWGPPDDGKCMPHPMQYQKAAMKKAIIQGREGKGVIFVTSSGNGKKKTGDNCSYDWLVNFEYTISVAAVDADGKVPNYSERCSAVMVAAYSGSGTKSDLRIVAPTNGSGCNNAFTGTSPSAALVSGVLALVLEANPNLNWREVQHIIAYTSLVYPMKDSTVWIENKAGFLVSHDFGFGLINAYDMVVMAKTFKSIPAMSTCVIPFALSKIEKEKRSFTRLKILRVEVNTQACLGLPSEINFLEHVQLEMSIQNPMRGSLQVDLISPQKTIAHLIEPRQKDRNIYGIKDWASDAIQMWGEFPRGYWTVVVSSELGNFDFKGSVEKLVLILHGTREQPPHYQEMRKYYDLT